MRLMYSMSYNNCYVNFRGAGYPGEPGTYDYNYDTLEIFYKFLKK